MRVRVGSAVEVVRGDGVTKFKAGQVVEAETESQLADLGLFPHHYEVDKKKADD